MEASEAAGHEPREGESEDGSEVQVASSGEDVAASQEPLGAEDAHGTVTPRSAPPAGLRPGLDADGKETVPPGEQAGGEVAEGGEE